MSQSADTGFIEEWISKLDPIGTLVQLKQLFLQKNHLADMRPLSLLIQLVELNLGENELQEIRKIETLDKLEILILNNNKITVLDHIPSNLRVLELHGNGLSEIGTNFIFNKIERLDLSQNNLSTFPLILGDKLNTKTDVNLRIGSNPFLKRDKGINKEAYRSENGKEVFQVFVSDYHIKKADVEEKKIKIDLPAKIILLGNSDVGKTTLANYLIGKKVKPGAIQSTRILNIMNWRIDSTGQALIYDFGGQDFYHSAFQLFLSEDCVYVFVWTRNTNQNQIQPATTKRPRPYHNYNLNYWLSNIQYLMQSGNIRSGHNLVNVEEIAVSTEIILLENKIDEDIKLQSSSQYDEKILSIRDTFRLSLAEKSAKVLGFDSRKTVLKSALSRLARDMSHTIDLNQTRQTLISNYIEDYNRLSVRKRFKLTDLYQTNDRFFEEYADRPMKGQSDKGDLSAALIILHNRGLLLKHPGANGGVWLVPNILIEKIKSFIGTAKEGVILRRKTEFEPFIQLCSFHSFVVLKSESELVVPSLLPESDDSILYRIANKGHSTLFRLKFAYFMPHGMINRIITGFGSSPSEKFYFKSTVIIDLLTMGNIFLKWDLEGLVIDVGLQLHKTEDLEKVSRYIYQNILASYHGYQGISWDKYSTYYNTGTGLVNSSSPPDLNPAWSGDSIDFSFWTQSINEKVPKDLLVSIDDQKITSISYFVNIHDAQSQVDLGQHLIRGSTLYPGNEQYKIYKSHQFSPFLKQVVKQPKKVFLSYAHDDMRFKIELQKYLINLERQGLIEIWQDGLIQAGDDWDNKIRFNLENADIVILLVSQNFIASNYIHEIEFRTAMTNRAEKKATVLPILLSDCDWQHWTVIPENLGGDDVLDDHGRAKSGKISNLQFMPMNDSGRLTPVVKWEQESEAWARVVGGIRSLL